jgi:anthranilate phosphoribosyltransferase
VRDAVLLATAGPTTDNLAAQLRVTLDQAAESPNSGAAEAALDRWVEASQKAAAAI